MTYKPFSKPEVGRATNTASGFMVVGHGLVIKNTVVGGKHVTHSLYTLYAPNMGQNLLSAHQFDREGGRILTEGGHTLITDLTGSLLFESNIALSDLYIIPLYQPSAESIVCAHLSVACTANNVIALSAS